MVVCTLVGEDIVVVESAEEEEVEKSSFYRNSRKWTSREFYSSEFDCSGTIVERFTVLLLTLGAEQLACAPYCQCPSSTWTIRRVTTVIVEIRVRQHFIEGVRLCRMLAKRLLYYWQMNSRATRLCPTTNIQPGLGLLKGKRSQMTE